MLMAGTILGPGTIFLMLVGAFVAAFRIDNWTSFTYNISPIVTFMVVCFTLKSKTQVRAKFFLLICILLNLVVHYYVLCVLEIGTLYDCILFFS